MELSESGTLRLNAWETVTLLLPGVYNQKYTVNGYFTLHDGESAGEGIKVIRTGVTANKMLHPTVEDGSFKLPLDSETRTEKDNTKLNVSGYDTDLIFGERRDICRVERGGGASVSQRQRGGEVYPRTWAAGGQCHRNAGGL